MGELVAGDRESYQYLVESIRRFPSQVITLSTIDNCFLLFIILLVFSYCVNECVVIDEFQEKFASMIADAGFQKVEYENLVGGVVAIHSGLKI